VPLSSPSATAASAAGACRLSADLFQIESGVLAGGTGSGVGTRLGSGAGLAAQGSSVSGLAAGSHGGVPDTLVGRVAVDRVTPGRADLESWPMRESSPGGGPVSANVPPKLPVPRA
jgi:hypothetical protein